MLDPALGDQSLRFEQITGIFIRVQSHRHVRVQKDAVACVDDAVFVGVPEPVQDVQKVCFRSIPAREGPHRADALNGLARQL